MDISLDLIIKMYINILFFMHLEKNNQTQCLLYAVQKF